MIQMTAEFRVRVPRRFPWPAALRRLGSLALALVLTANLGTFHETAAQSLSLGAADGTFFIRGGTVIPTGGERLEGAGILIQDGRIAAVGRDIRAPADATVIDATGKYVYPGMINSNTSLGLSEISAVEVTVDLREAGDFNPHIRAINAVNPHTQMIPITRVNGVTSAITRPMGGIISGQAALLQLDGWTAQAMALRPYAALIMNVPGGGGRGPRGGGARTPPDLQEVYHYFAAAREYHRVRAEGAGPVDLGFEALGPVLEGEVPVIINANGRQQIETALSMAEELGIRIIIVGGRGSYHLADRLAEEEIPVVLGSLQSTVGADDPYDAIYAEPGVLHRAGVKLAFSTGDVANARHVAHHAALAMAYGLPEDAALNALTIWPAQIWGVDGEIGSIEVGKSADLFVSTGSPMDARSQVEHVFIAGRQIPFDDYHTALFEKFKIRPLDR